DLSLKFESRDEHLEIRQIALAEMALKRMSLEKWLAAHQRRRAKHHRAVGSPESIEGGFRQVSRRRKRFFLKRGPRELVTLAWHDEARDRLMIVEASSLDLVEHIARE